MRVGMLQLYFLSIVLNITSGCALASDYLADRSTVFTNMRDFFKASHVLKITLAVLTFIVGFFKFISVTKGDTPVVGDFFPAICGLIGGTTLFLDYYRESSTSFNSQFVETLNRVFLDHKSIVGIGSIIIGLLHFIFPQAIFL